MARTSKNYSHIWDNVLDSNKRQHHHFYRDSTGSSVSTLVEYSRQEITVTEENFPPSLPRHEPPIPVRPKKAANNFVTNRERELAEPPKQLAPWKFQPERRQKYVSHNVPMAFEDYQRRLRSKKLKLEEEKLKKLAEKSRRRRVTINEVAAEVLESRPLCSKNCTKLRVTTHRNDEIKLDAFLKKLEFEEDESDDVIRPGFYGTIEAEKCAEKVAAHISLASENLERLQFVADDVFPESIQHLKKLRHISDDIREFNRQSRDRRVAPPTGAGPTQVAHFLVNEKCADGC